MRINYLLCFIGKIVCLLFVPSLKSEDYSLYMPNWLYSIRDDKYNIQQKNQVSFLG